MKQKVILLMAIVFLFVGCSDKNNKDMYGRKYNIFDTHLPTSAENDYRSVQNGENPMKRPSYDEYREK